MNNPSENRESWKEFQQDMQDFVLDVIVMAEEDYDYAAYGGHSNFTREMQADLIEWVELRYLDGKNFRDSEAEYFAWDDHWTEVN